MGPGARPARQPLLDELERQRTARPGRRVVPGRHQVAAVRRPGQGPVVVANGAEGEPASGKDRLLVHQLPHLVLDGAAVAARTLGRDRVFVHVHDDAVAAVAGRGRRTAAARHRPGARIEVWWPPTGTSPARRRPWSAPSAERKPGHSRLPGSATVRDQGVGGRPTLVQNVESLAHVALVARFGAEWFRSVGTAESPGTSLFTVTGRWAEPRIVEVPARRADGPRLGIGAGDARAIQAVLLGGYGGGWLPTAAGPGHAHDRGGGPAARVVARGRRRGAAARRGVPAGRGGPGRPLHGGPGSRTVRAVHPRPGRVARGLELLAYRPRSFRGGLSVPS